MIEPRPYQDHQVAALACSSSDRGIVASERYPTNREGERAEPSERPSPVDWEMVAIWSFVVFSFAAFFLCTFVLWVKCRAE